MEQRIKDQVGDVKASYAPTAKLVWFSPTGEPLADGILNWLIKVDFMQRPTKPCRLFY